MRNRRRIPLLFVITAAIALSATQLLAHAVVYPKRALPGAYEKYVLRVPNERDQPTTRVEIRFPDNVTVVSFADVQGWKLQVVTDSAKRITGAVWTGTLPAARFVEFPFVAVNPRSDTTLVWPTFQTYADGERVEWTGPEGSDAPASVTIVGSDSGMAGDASNTASEDTVTDRAAGGLSGVAGPLSIAAIVLSLLALGVAARRAGGPE
jgi:uncharacterized protein YcnI